MAADTIQLFLNPAAGRGRAGKRLSRILQLLEQRGLELDVHQSGASGDLEDQVCSRVSEGASRIIVAGGDGSIHEATNGILRADGTAALGVIPTGTGNDFAKACSISLNWEHATRLLAERIAADQKPRPIDAGRCNNRFFANGAGIGFDAKVTSVARSIDWPIGDVVYLVAIFKTMFDDITTPRVTIFGDRVADDKGDHEHEIWDGPLTLAAVCNGQWVGGMFHIAPTASNDDARMELIIAKPMTRWRITTLLSKLMKGSHLSHPDIAHYTIRKLRIVAEGLVPSQLDGEVQPLQSEFDIEILPGALQLL